MLPAHPHLLGRLADERQHQHRSTSRAARLQREAVTTRALERAAAAPRCPDRLPRHWSWRYG